MRRRCSWVGKSRKSLWTTKPYYELIKKKEPPQRTGQTVYVRNKKKKAAIWNSNLWGKEQTLHQHAAWETREARRYHATRKPWCIVLTETWWGGDSHDQTGYWWLTSYLEGKGEEGREEALSSFKKGIDCEETSLKNGHEEIESFQIRIRDRSNSLWLVSTAGHLTRQRLLVKPPSSS